MNRITHTAGRFLCFLVLAGLLIAGGAGSAWGYLGGSLTNQLVGATYSLIGGNNDPTTVGTGGHAWSGVTFATATNLVGVLVVVDNWTQGSWKTWEVRDLDNNVLATSQVGVAGSPTGSEPSLWMAASSREIHVPRRIRSPALHRKDRF